jgi:hypothetical protein
VTISARIKRDKSITICMQWISTFRDRERERERENDHLQNAVVSEFIY